MTSRPSSCWTHILFISPVETSTHFTPGKLVIGIPDEYFPALLASGFNFHGFRNQCRWTRGRFMLSPAKEAGKFRSSFQQRVQRFILLGEHGRRLIHFCEVPGNPSQTARPTHFPADWPWFAQDENEGALESPGRLSSGERVDGTRRGGLKPFEREAKGARLQPKKNPQSRKL